MYLWGKGMKSDLCLYYLRNSYRNNERTNFYFVGYANFFE